MTNIAGLPKPPDGEAGEASSYPIDLLNLAKIVTGTDELSPEDVELIRSIEDTNWKEKYFDMDLEESREEAARGLALGVPLFHPFANFYALTFHPHKEVMRSVNASKGRGLEQVASIVTTKENVDALFDWSKLPKRLDEKKVRDTIDQFFSLGPFGFRGPATEEIIENYPHLTSDVNGISTVQLIAPGYQCESNMVIDRALEISGKPFMAITSANLSKKLRGGVAQPAHYKMSGIQEDFGNNDPGAIILGHAARAERNRRKRYPHHEPMSTSIISFHSPNEGGAHYWLERHGSLHADKVSGELEKLGLQCGFDPNINEMRLPRAKYPFFS